MAIKKKGWWRVYYEGGYCYVMGFVGIVRVYGYWKIVEVREKNQRKSEKGKRRFVNWDGKMTG